MNQELQTRNITRGSAPQTEPLTVMVLKATDTFKYESHGVKKMFHATVATVNQYFYVKVFDINLKEKFTENNFIIISNYFKNKGILEIREASSASEATPNQEIAVPSHIIQNANESLKIHDIQNVPSGTLVYGLFTLHRKNVKKKNTIYEIKDDTGIIEVVGNGKWFNINCEEGDKFQLFCFQLQRKKNIPQLTCGEHSFIKIQQRKKLLKESFEEDGYHRGPKQVMILTATKVFTYDSIKNNRMFLATVATETEFFRLMVFEENLQEKFSPGNVIALSDYFSIYGCLVIHKYSSVSVVKIQNKKISNSSDVRPMKHLKICDLYLQTKEMPVDGEFKVYRKSTGNNCICYGIWDDTGAMKVVVSGHLTSVNCEIGDTIRLVGFELTSNADEWFLRTTRYSYMEVITPEK